MTSFIHSCSNIFLVCLVLSGGFPSLAAQTADPMRYSVMEEVPPGTIIADVVRDLGLRRRYSPDIIGQLEFRILTQAGASTVGGGSESGGGASAQFVIDLKTGVVATGDVPLDRDVIIACKDRDVCDVTLDVAIRPAQYFQIVKVTVEIIDVNDNAPTFREPRSVVPIRESSAVGSSVAVPVASDLDSPSMGIKRYELLSNNPSVLESFELRSVVRRDGSLDPRIFIKRLLDREVEDQYSFQLAAYDGGIPAKSAIIDIIVSVLDSNDNSPVFTELNYSVNISENIPIGTKILRVQAVDKDIGLNGAVIYRLSPQTLSLYGHLFAIDDVTGEISIRGEVDHETFAVHQLSVIAQDQGPDSLPIDTAVVVRVIDVNDNAPLIVVNTLTRKLPATATGSGSTATAIADVMENLPIGAFVAHVSVSDPDSGVNGHVECNVSDPAFRLVERYPTEFQVTTAEQLDREVRARYDLELICGDKGLPRLFSRKVLPVRVLDANDNRPTFTSSTYSGRLVENNYVGTAVLQVTARDVDEGSNADFHYVLASGVSSTFEITTSGMIIARTVVDREHFSSFSFTVMAVDHGTPALTGTALVLISVEDLNDEIPIFSMSSYTFTVAEGEKEGSNVGRVAAEDSDAPPNNVVQYSFYPDDRSQSDAFALDAKTGIITTTRELDREMVPVYLLTVMAKDSGSPAMSGTATVTIFVQDKNDHRPVFEFPTSSNDTLTISNKVPLGAIIGRVTAYDLDIENNARITYQLKEGSDGAFSVDPNDGTIFVNVRLLHVQRYVYELVIVASDQGYPVGWTKTTLRICVNSSLPYSDESAEGRTVDAQDEATFNLAVIVAIASGSSVVVVILLVLIAAVRQHSRRRKCQRYKNRMGALRAMTAHELTKARVADSGQPLTEEDPAEPVTPAVVSGPVVVNGCLKTANGNTGRVPNGCLKVASGNGLANSGSGSSGAEHHLPVPRQVMGESERESMHSGEGSNADSGHGHSEEDEVERAARLLLHHVANSDATSSRATRHSLVPPPPPRVAYFNRIYDSSSPSWPAGSSGPHQDSDNYKQRTLPNSILTNQNAGGAQQKYLRLQQQQQQQPLLQQHRDVTRDSLPPQYSNRSPATTVQHTGSDRGSTVPRQNGTVWKFQDPGDGFLV